MKNKPQNEIGWSSKILVEYYYIIENLHFLKVRHLA